MAQVDFSNAIIDVNGNNTPLAAQSDRTLELAADWYLSDSSGTQINTGATMSVVVSDKNKKAMVYSGTFTASGTEFYTTFTMWKISNVSFQSGDTYSFMIEVEID